MKPTYRVNVWQEDDWWLAQVVDASDGAAPAPLNALTQARNLAKIEPIARDLIATILDVDESDFDVSIQYLLDGESAELVCQARGAREWLEAAQALWQERSAAAARTLTGEGYSLRETATLLSLSHQRVDQILDSRPELKQGGAIIFCEGPSDAALLRQLFPAATSNDIGPVVLVAGGSLGSWVISHDDRENGYFKTQLGVLLHEAASSIGRERTLSGVAWKAGRDRDMARVEWSRIEPGDIEQLVAMLLCRENPAAQRIRPSRGDGGIDVLVPVGDGSTFAVYQIKSFSSRLTAGRKAQVERSFHRLLDFAKEQGLHVTEWYLTLPLDATHANLKWFADLTSGHDLVTGWRGLSFLEGLVGTYPSVVDYYLRNGKERLHAALESLTAVLRMNMRASPMSSDDRSDSSRVLDPGGTIESLAYLHAVLNECDPHFYYDFSVSRERPEVTDQPGLVAVVQDNYGERCVTFMIFAWCAASLIERPIPISLTVQVSPDDDLYRDIQAFETYGRSFTTPTGTVSGSVDLPGGLGGSFSDASVTLGPATIPNSECYEIRLQLLDESGKLLAETMINMQPPSVGINRRGVRAYGTEEHGAFTFEVMTDLDTQTAKFTLGRIDLTGKVPSLLLPGLRLWREFRHPHRFRIAAPFGPVAHSPQPIPSNPTDTSDIGVLYDLVEALAVIQEYTSNQIRVPDFQTFTMDDMRRILRVADLLRGGTLSAPWEPFTAHLNPGTAPSRQPMTMLLYRELRVRLGDAEASLGYEQVYLPAARMEIDTLVEHGSHQDVRISPIGSNPAIIRHRQQAPTIGEHSIIHPLPVPAE